jgi:hypothetical protein
MLKECNAENIFLFSLAMTLGSYIIPAYIREYRVVRCIHTDRRTLSSSAGLVFLCANSKLLCNEGLKHDTFSSTRHRK